MAPDDAAADDLCALFDDLAHDLRSPLAVIQGYSGLLSLDRTGPLTTRQREFLTGIREQQELLHARLEAFIVMAAYLGGRRPLRARPFDLAVELSRYLADADRAGRARLDPPADGRQAEVQVSADPELLGHVLDLLGPPIAAAAGPHTSLHPLVRAGADRGWICFVAEGLARAAWPADRDLAVARRLLDLLGATLVRGAPPDLAHGDGPVVGACGLPRAASRRQAPSAG